MLAYVCGDVTYSEGCNDDLNKIVSSCLWWQPKYSLTNALKEYSRVFFPQLDENDVCDAFFSMEQSWIGDPCNNPNIEKVLAYFNDFVKRSPQIYNNWRFQMHYFRAIADAFIRRRYIREKSLEQTALSFFKAGALDETLNICETPLPIDEKYLLSHLWELGYLLFASIGMQLDVEHFKGVGAERGCVLNTIERPVSNLAWIANRIKYIKSLPKVLWKEEANIISNRDTLANGEFSHSFSIDGCNLVGGRKYQTYLDFRNDEKNADGLYGNVNLRTLRGYDDWEIEANIDGLINNKEYILTAFYFKDLAGELILSGNGKEFYRSDYGYGGEINESYNARFAQNRTVRQYLIPADIVENGRLKLKWSTNEHEHCVVLAEFFIKLK